MDLNRVILIGRLASEPELKYTPSGIAVTQFRLAVNRPMSAEARQNGQEKQADFISIVAWRQSAEYAANYLGKGRLVAIEGRLQVREYVTQDGQRRRDTEVVVDQLKSLDRPKENGEGGGSRYGDAPASRYHDEPAEAPAARYPQGGGATNRRPAPAPAAAHEGGYAPEDDLDDPFADS